MPQTLKIALIGCGAIAPYHLRGIHELGGRVRVTVAVDPDIEKARSIADEIGASSFASLDEAFEANGFDAVDIMVPHHLHESLAIRAFDQGKHVLLEKPMATTLDACARILAAAKSAGTVFMVAENAQYWPQIIRAKELIDAGAIGEVLTARAAFVSRYDEQWFSGDSPWRLDSRKTGGGVAIDGGSHWIRPLRMWMGEIEEVVATIGNSIETMEGESMVNALLRFDSGKIATFNALTTDGPLGPVEWWRVTGRAGEIVIEGGFNGALKLFDADSPEGRRVGDVQGYEKSFGAEIHDFTSAVLAGSRLAAGPEESIAELRAALAIYRSARSGAWEKVWDSPD